MTAAPSRDVVRDAVGSFVHQALFYRDSTEYIAGIVPAVNRHLARQEPIAIAVPGARLPILRAALPQADARIRWIDITREGGNPGRIIPKVLFSFAEAHPDDHVLIVAEAVWPGRNEIEYPACAHLEALINIAFADSDATILCPYDADRLTEAELADAMATHPMVVGTGGGRANDRYSPDWVLDRSGEPLPEPDQAETWLITLSELAAGRGAAMSFAERAGLGPHRIPDVQIVTEELLANAVRYGDGTARLRLWTEEIGVVCEISGTGQITDPLAGQLPAAPTQQGGRGLLLVNHFADLVRFHSSSTGTVSRAYFRLD